MKFRFERLELWPLALEYASACFDLCQPLPRALQSSLGDQVRRAATSILANTAEGAGKSTSRSQHNYYDIAHGSVAESVALLLLFRRRQLMTEETFYSLYEQANRISAMLWGLRQAAETAHLAEPQPEYGFASKE